MEARNHLLEAEGKAIPEDNEVKAEPVYNQNALRKEDVYNRTPLRVNQETSGLAQDIFDKLKRAVPVQEKPTETEVAAAPAAAPMTGEEAREADIAAKRAAMAVDLTKAESPMHEEVH